MSFEIHRIDDTYVAVDDEHGIVLTPGGNNLTTRFPALLGAALENLKNYGPDTVTKISLYNLVCTYIDLSLRLSKHDLIEPIVQDLPIDIVFDLPASPEANHFLRRCYSNNLFDRLGLRPSLDVPPDLGRLKDGIRSELEGLSKRQLSTIIYFSACLESGLLGMAVVTCSIDLSGLAQAYCTRLHNYLAGRQSDSLATGGAGEQQQNEYEPEVYDQTYCDCECCIGGEQDHPLELNSSCELIQMLETVQRFCAFPDE